MGHFKALCLLQKHASMQYNTPGNTYSARLHNAMQYNCTFIHRNLHYTFFQPERILLIICNSTIQHNTGEQMCRMLLSIKSEKYTLLNVSTTTQCAVCRGHVCSQCTCILHDTDTSMQPHTVLITGLYSDCRLRSKSVNCCYVKKKLLHT